MQCYELWSTPSQLSSPTLFSGPDIKKSNKHCTQVYIISVERDFFILVVTDFQFVWVGNINLAIGLLLYHEQ